GLKTGDSYQQFYEIWVFLDVAGNTIERVKPAVDENTAKYETYNADLEAMEDTFRKVAEASEIEGWALMIHRKHRVVEQLRESRNEENADLNTMFTIESLVGLRTACPDDLKNLDVFELKDEFTLIEASKLFVRGA
ncbi:unnamed protein product, partial [Didymodactylos carnosus]